MNQFPFVTVITVVRNGCAEIEETIKSVISQTYPNLEYIVIDGNSNDGTIQVIDKYIDKITRFISEPDKGIYDAMNKGIVMANGEWINFMNCGDTFYKNDSIESFFAQANTNKPNDILYGDVIMQYPFGTYFKDCSCSKWCHQSMFTRAEVLKKYLYDISFKILADADFVLRAQLNGSVLSHTSVVVAKYKNYAGASTSNRLKLFYEESRLNKQKKDIRWYGTIFSLKTKETIRRIILSVGGSAYLSRRTKKIVEECNYMMKVK